MKPIKELRYHLDIIEKCKKQGPKGTALLATLPGKRYPYVYPRDAASCSRFLAKLSQVSEFKKESLDLLEGMARFILSIQRDDGYWGQRYRLNGEDASIYRQEDNIAHSIRILMNYSLAFLEQNREVRLQGEITDALKNGMKYAVENYYRQGIDLFASTTSIHETTIEQGYTIWVNFSYLKALKLSMDYLKTFRDEEQTAKTADLMKDSYN